jgi:hypothetical protein
MMGLLRFQFGDLEIEGLDVIEEFAYQSSENYLYACEAHRQGHAGLMKHEEQK